MAFEEIRRRRTVVLLQMTCGDASVRRRVTVLSKYLW